MIYIPLYVQKLVVKATVILADRGKREAIYSIRCKSYHFFSNFQILTPRYYKFFLNFLEIDANIQIEVKINSLNFFLNFKKYQLLYYVYFLKISFLIIYKCFEFKKYLIK